jgi:hypothetical protein
MQRPTSTRYFAGLSRNTFLLAFASLFADISTEMLYPVLPIFLTQTLKASGSIVARRRRSVGMRASKQFSGESFVVLVI